MDIRGWFRRSSLLARPTPHSQFVYAGHHKCATQFTERVLRAVCQLKGLRADTFDARNPAVDPHAQASLHFLLLTDYSSGMVDADVMSRARGVHVVRDPRDLLVSMYFSHRYSHSLNHEEIVRNRSVLETLDESEGLHYMMDQSRFFGRVIGEIDRWDYSRENFFETTFEALTSDPTREFERILMFLGLGLAPGELARIVGKNDFKTLRDAWAAKNPTAEFNHYRRGVHGDWREHLTGTIRDRFCARYGDLLIKLGYETGYHW